MTDINTAAIAEVLPVFHLEAQGVQALDARTLHTWLGIGRDFSTWFKQMINELDLEEGKEYSPNLGSGADLRKQGITPGYNRKDYALTLDAAKEICLIQRSKKGKLTRRYLIQTERKAQAAGIAPATTSEVSALELAQIQTIRAKAIADIAATALEGNYKDQVLRGAIALAKGEAKEETNQDIIFFENFLKDKGVPTKYLKSLTYTSTLAHQAYKEDHGHPHEKYPHPFKNIRVIGWQKDELHYLEKAWESYGKAKYQTLLAENAN